MKSSKEQKGIPFLQLAIRITISSSLMVWLLNRIQWDQALQIMKEGSLVYFVAAFIAIQLTVGSSVWKWQLLVHSSLQKTERKNTSLTKLGRYYYIGLFFNNFLPGSVGGDVVRIFYLGKIIGIPPAATSVAFERLTSGAALTAIVLVSALFMENVRPFLLSIYIVTGAVVVLFVFIGFWMKKGNKSNALILTTSVPSSKFSIWKSKGKSALVKMGESVGNYRSESWKWWVTILVLSAIFQFGLAWINQLLFLAFGISIPWVELLVIITLISVITMLPVSLNGIGVREASYVFFFKELGVPDELAVSVSLLFFFLVTLSSIFGGVFWLFERRKRFEAIRQ
ncbi:lysylphosphatidylglycerol synthase transmembrane domain-containing protein [Bacillus sp. 1NLA3E]|uniref:lysylphosphatidylglycerol synthase transmembrane domain-containing protein n=1 Tax=Bacillus sp. 1NLA3E TaxID=666686 RepID=UPI000247EA5F|nr:lysylphosphatidylglycerol synthase transmembrane domain-containing protein [Bacillus sp. 1NLA3E]AGK52426.1 integral membrane protein [Bacillus sp. 1NLA3E]